MDNCSESLPNPIRKLLEQHPGWHLVVSVDGKQAILSDGTHRRISLLDPELAQALQAEFCALEAQLREDHTDHVVLLSHFDRYLSGEALCYFEKHERVAESRVTKDMTEST